MKVVMIHGQNHKGSTYNIGRQIAEKIIGSGTDEKIAGSEAGEKIAGSEAGEKIAGSGVAEKIDGSEVTETIADNGNIVEFFLPRDLNHFCIGCYKCIEDVTACPFFEEKNRIMSEVESADILIFTSPTYCLRESGPMKSFLDLTFNYWMSHRPRQCMFSKKAIVISTCAGSGANKTVKAISEALFYWGVPYILKYGIGVQAMSWDGISDKKKQKIDKDTTKIARKVVAKKNVRVGVKTRGLFALMRMMQKANFGSGEADRKYWEEQGWLDKKRPWG